MSRVVCLAALLLVAAGCAGAPEGVHLADIHGLAVDPEDPDSLFVATHHGLFVGTDGSWSSVTREPFDMMGFTMHPSDPDVMWASGHPARASRADWSVGVQKSEDGGVTWRLLGLRNEVDFHAFTVSRADPERLWGFDSPDLYTSDDGGVSWDRTPVTAFNAVWSLGSTQDDRDGLWAATDRGVGWSQDAGATWTVKRPGGALAVATGTDPRSVAAYFANEGVFVSVDGGVTWQSRGLQDVAAVFALAIDPSSPLVMYAGTQDARILRTSDAGVTWTTFYEN